MVPFKHLAVLTLASVFSLGFASPASLDDEVCIVNLSDIDVIAGTAGNRSKTINQNDNAFCITVSLANAGPNVGAGGTGMWAKAGDHYIEVDIEDPYIGTLDFSQSGEDFHGADLGPDLHMFAPQKGDDGVYRLIIRRK